MPTTQQVRRIFEELFSSYPSAEALWEALSGYDEKEPPRVQLAILKLSEGDPEKLVTYIEAAKRDYRDVLAWAEYPEQLRSGKTDNTSQEEYEAILERDRKQYEAWLGRFVDPGTG